MALYDNIVLRHKFDTDWTDTAALQGDATPSGAVFLSTLSPVVYGKLNDGVYFDGTDDFVTLDASLTLGGTNQSYSYWIRMDSTDDMWGEDYPPETYPNRRHTVLYSLQCITLQHGYFGVAGGGQIGLCLWNGASPVWYYIVDNYYTTATNGFNMPSVLDLWHHYTHTINGSTGLWTVYRDGVLIFSATVNTAYLKSSLTDAQLGKDADATNLYNRLHGRLDEFCVWGRTLAQADATALFREVPVVLSPRNCDWGLDGETIDLNATWYTDPGYSPHPHMTVVEPDTTSTDYDLTGSAGVYSYANYSFDQNGTYTMFVKEDPTVKVQFTVKAADDHGQLIITSARLAAIKAAIAAEDAFTLKLWDLVCDCYPGHLTYVGSWTLALYLYHYLLLEPAAPDKATWLANVLSELNTIVTTLPVNNIHNNGPQMASVAMAYDEIWNEIPFQQRNDTRRYLLDMLSYATNYTCSTYFDEESLASWDNNIWAGWMATYVAELGLRSELPSWLKTFHERRLKIASEASPPYFSDDGVGSDGAPYYSQFTFLYISIVSELKKIYEGINLLLMSRYFENYGYWMAKSLYKISQESSPMAMKLGDTTGSVPQLWLAYVLSANEFADPLLQDFAERIYDGSFYLTPQGNQLIFCLLWYNAALAAGDWYTHGPKVGMYQNGLHAFSRSSWDPDSFWVAFLPGKYTSTHSHRDFNSFMLASHGELLFGDAGYAFYWRTTAEEHSTLLVDGWGQRGENNHPWDWATTSTCTNWYSSEEDRYLQVVGDMSDGYRVGAQLSLFKRHYSALDRYVFIADEVRTNSAKTYELRFHAPTGVTITEETDDLLATFVSSTYPNSRASLHLDTTKTSTVETSYWINFDLDNYTNPPAPDPIFEVIISDISLYNGTYAAYRLDSTHFYFEHEYVGTAGTGNWDQGSDLNNPISSFEDYSGTVPGMVKANCASSAPYSTQTCEDYFDALRALSPTAIIPATWGTHIKQITPTPTASDWFQNLIVVAELSQDDEPEPVVTEIRGSGYQGWSIVREDEQVLYLLNNAEDATNWITHGDWSWRGRRITAVNNIPMGTWKCFGEDIYGLVYAGRNLQTDTYWSTRVAEDGKWETNYGRWVPEFSTNYSRLGYTGVPISFTVSASTHGDATSTFTAIGLPGPPAVATFVTDTFTWTPDATQRGRYHVLLTATSVKGQAALQDVELLITENTTGYRPILAAVPSLTIPAGTALSLDFTGWATTGTETTTSGVTLTAASLPGDAVFTPSGNTGTLTWANPVAGTYERVSVIATYGAYTFTESFNIRVVYAGGTAPQFVDTTAAYSVTVGQKFIRSFDVKDVDGDFILYSISSLPAGASFDNQTGEFTWVPRTSQVAGGVVFTVTATDGIHSVDLVDVTFTVAAATAPKTAGRLLGHWTLRQSSLEGTDYQDQTINQNAATLHGTPASTADRHGQLARALTLVAFDEEYLEVPDADIFSFGVASTHTDLPFSLSVWIYWDEDNFDFSKGIYNTSGEWHFYVDSTGTVRLRLFDEDVADAYIGRKASYSLVSPGWYHISTTYSGSGTAAGIKVFVNGVRMDDSDDNSVASYVHILPGSHAVWIGRYDATYSEARISDVKIFGRELSVSEVSLLADSY